MDNTNFVVILAEGVGSRFRPVSRSDFPKQFLEIADSNETLLQKTFRRFSSMVPAEQIFISIPKCYADMVKEQVPEINEENIIGQPLPRNTAPSIAYAAFKLFKKDPAASMIVTPADHLILNQSAFEKACMKGFSFSRSHNALVTIGVNPTYPATAFGYIQKEPEESVSGVFKVKQFIEKPYLELARSFLRSGDFLWNAGIFIWTVEEILNAYRFHLPAMYGQFASVQESFDTSEESAQIDHVFSNCEDVSIDFAIMEKSAEVYTIPAGFEWLRCSG